MKIKEMTRYELIDMIRMRTAMYIGHLSPTHLSSFLSGYYIAKRIENFKEEKPSFYGFHNWVADKFGYSESTSGWAYMIEDQREDKEEALYLFYELLDEYRDINHRQIARIDFSHEETTNRTWRGYSRLRKIRGTFEELPKPLPNEIIIREMNLNDKWFQMVAKNESNEILFTSNFEELEKIFENAKNIFGIEKEEWEIS